MQDIYSKFIVSKKINNEYLIKNSLTNNLMVMLKQMLEWFLIIDCHWIGW